VTVALLDHLRKAGDHAVNDHRGGLTSMIAVPLGQGSAARVPPSDARVLNIGPVGR